MINTENSSSKNSPFSSYFIKSQIFLFVLSIINHWNSWFGVWKKRFHQNREFVIFRDFVKKKNWLMKNLKIEAPERAACSSLWAIAGLASIHNPISSETRGSKFSREKFVSRYWGSDIWDTLYIETAYTYVYHSRMHSYAWIYAYWCNRLELSNWAIRSVFTRSSRLIFHIRECRGWWTGGIIKTRKTYVHASGAEVFDINLQHEGYMGKTLNHEFTITKRRTARFMFTVLECRAAWLYVHEFCGMHERTNITRRCVRMTESLFRPGRFYFLS